MNRLEMSMEDEKIDEQVWQMIRYLDPDERDKGNEAVTAIIAILAILLICTGVWILFWLRVRQL